MTRIERRIREALYPALLRFAEELAAAGPQTEAKRAVMAAKAASKATPEIFENIKREAM